MTEKEKMLAGEVYNPGDEELMKLHHEVLVLLKEYNDIAFVKPAEDTPALPLVGGTPAQGGDGA